MAYYATGPCMICEQPFQFNPTLVPSHPWPVPDGPKRPICESCMCRVNEERAQLGEEPWPIPAGAYQPAEGALE